MVQEKNVSYYENLEDNYLMWKSGKAYMKK